MSKYNAPKKYKPTVREGEAPVSVSEPEQELERPRAVVRARSSEAPVGPVDNGLVRPEAKKRIEALRAERAARGPRVPRRAQVAPSWWDELWRPFEIWRERYGELQEGPERTLEDVADIIIPDAERAYIEKRRQAYKSGAAKARYSSVERTERPSYVRPGAEEAASSGRPSYSRPSSAAAPAVNLADMVTPAYVDQVFDLEKVFGRVKDLKADPKFDGSAGIGVIAPAGIDPWGKVLETAKFFGITDEAYSGIPREKVWDDVFGPFLGAVINDLNNQKPADLPGTFVFGTSPKGSFGLIYTEDSSVPEAGSEAGPREGGFGGIPSSSEMDEAIARAFDLKAIFKEVQNLRANPLEVEEAKKHKQEAGDGNPPRFHLQTVAEDGKDDPTKETFKFFGFPTGFFDSILADIESDDNAVSNRAADLLSKIDSDFDDAVMDAFERVQPEDLPGYFALSNDIGSDHVILCYFFDDL